MKALLNGFKVTWAHEAKVFDEKPLTMKQSLKQRQRWMQGHCTVASHYLPKLLWQGIRQRNLALLDAALYCLNPHFLMLGGFGILYEVFQGLPVLHTPLYLIAFLAEFIYFGIPLLLEKIGPDVTAGSSTSRSSPFPGCRWPTPALPPSPTGTGITRCTPGTSPGRRCL